MNAITSKELLRRKREKLMRPCWKCQKMKMPAEFDWYYKDTCTACLKARRARPRMGKRKRELIEKQKELE